MRAYAQEELNKLEPRVALIEEELKVLLLPKDPNDEKNIILEIRAGTGGDEATLFAAEIFRMYTRFAETQRWKVEILSSSESSAGGLKEVIAIIEGNRVFSQLKYESGVHRVQRVPATEQQGRVHTSAVTVAVLPEAEDVDIINPHSMANVMPMTMMLVPHAIQFQRREFLNPPIRSLRLMSISMRIMTTGSRTPLRTCERMATLISCASGNSSTVSAPPTMSSV